MRPIPAQYITACTQILKKRLALIFETEVKVETEAEAEVKVEDEVERETEIKKQGTKTAQKIT